MATKEEIIAGLELTVSQAKRTTALWAEGEWDWKRATGWTPKETYSHLAAVAGIVPQLGQGLAGAPEGSDIAQAMDINAMNAQAVAGMASMTPQQVMETFETNYGKLIDFVKEAPDELLSQKRSFLSEPIPVSDILANTIVLHGLHHVYEANSRFESPV
jgi:NAD(P)-dependent dehydrogenase (short-subunit alcohol dehydrogenase family)